MDNHCVYYDQEYPSFSATPTIYLSSHTRYSLLYKGNFIHDTIYLKMHVKSVDRQTDKSISTKHASIAVVQLQHPR